MKLFPFLVLAIISVLILKVGIVASAGVNISFEVKDENGNPLQDSLVIVQGIDSSNSDFSESKLTSSDGKVSFTLNKNELFIYIVYKLSYSQETGSFLASTDNNTIITLKKLSSSQWYFYRINNGEMEFQFNSTDADTNYTSGEYINNVLEIRNVAETNIQLIKDTATFRVVDGETGSPLRAWGDFISGENDFGEITLKKEGWVKITIGEETVEICGGNIVITYEGTTFDLSGDESVCVQKTQHENKIPEWILQNDYKFEIKYFYNINGQEKNIGFTSQNFFISNSEWKPEIISVPETNLTVGNEWTYQINLKEYDESYSKLLNLINYKIIEAPEGMTINKDTGLVSWTPNQNGESNVILRVYHEYFENNSEKIAYSDQEFTLNVTGGVQNNAPIITSTPITEINESSQYNYQITATDANGDSLTYSLTEAPPWLSIDSSGLVSGITPEVSADTNFSVTIEVSDGQDTDTQTYTLTVIDVQEPVNNPPVIVSNPITSVNENSEYNYNVEATDSEGDSLTYSLTEAPGWLSIDADTGLISGTSPQVDSDTNFSVTIEVSDGTDTTTQTYSLTVVNVPEPNNPPIISSNPVTEVNEESEYIYQVTATDADNDSLTYGINGPNWLSIDSAGLVSGTSPEVSADTAFDITITVSDGTDSDTQSYVLTVTNINNAPIITSNPIITVNENSQYSYQATATDADNETLTYSLTEAPPWLSIDSNTGLVSGTTPDISSDTDYNITIGVSDGTDSATQNYILTVKRINNVPVITSTAITKINEEEDYFYQVTASDSDDDVLSFSLIESPQWLSISGNGLISGTVPSVSIDTEYNVSVKVSDGESSSIQEYILTVANVNKAPVITSIPLKEIKEKANYEYKVEATDADGDSLTYSISGPNWLSIDSKGLITGIVPVVSGNSDFNVSVEVSDSKGGVAIQDYIITVTDIVSSKSNRKSNTKVLPRDEFYEQKLVEQTQNSNIILNDENPVVLTVSQKNSLIDKLETVSQKINYSSALILIILNMNIVTIIILFVIKKLGIISFA